MTGVEEELGRPLVDVLELARARNPGVEVGIEERPRKLALEVGPREPVMLAALVVRTGRGEMEFFRDPRERWSDVFRRAGLL